MASALIEPVFGLTLLDERPQTKDESFRRSSFVLDLSPHDALHQAGDRVPCRPGERQQ